MLPRQLIFLSLQDCMQEQIKKGKPKRRWIQIYIYFLSYKLNTENKHVQILITVP